MELFVGVQNGFAGQVQHSHRLIIAPTSAMARLLIAVLAVTTTSAFKTPKRALKVRGGVDIQKVGTALIGLEGIVGMIAPETACKNYGHTPSPDDVQFKRYTSSWLAALAMLLSSDASSAASTSLFLSAAVTTVCMPVVEALGVDKPSVSAWIVVCIVLGKLSKTGHLNKWVAPTLAIALGLADTFFTEAHYKLYGLDTMSPFSRMFAQLLGS